MVTVSASCMYSLLPAIASGVSIANKASDRALVGPDMTWRLEPNNAATTQGTMAVYKPYWGGKPASMANAIAWGSTKTAPSKPAIVSARNDRTLTSWVQSPNKLDSKEATDFMEK